jgi:hypothetical protein
MNYIGPKHSVIAGFRSVVSHGLRYHGLEHAAGKLKYIPILRVAMGCRDNLFQLCGAIAGLELAAVIVRGFAAHAGGEQESSIMPVLYLHAENAVI